MDRPGLSRAVPMGVLGFLVGALLVVIVRALQSMDAIWDAQVGLVFGTFFAAGFFVWGIGAFDPRLNAHGEGVHEPEHAETPADDAAHPVAVFSHSMWQLILALLIFIVGVAVFARLGPTLITTADPQASVEAVGMVPMNLFGRDLLVSQLVLFAAFIIFTIVSLVVFGALISYVFTALSREMTASRAEPRPATAGERTAAPTTPMQALVFIALFILIFSVIYLLFFYVLIGLVIPNAVGLNFALSAIQALILTILILRPMWIVRIVAKVAGWLALVLRGGNRVDGTAKIDRRNRP